MLKNTALTKPQNCGAWLHYEFSKLNRRWRYSARTDEGIVKWFDSKDDAHVWMEEHYPHDYYVHDSAVN